MNRTTWLLLAALVALSPVVSGCGDVGSPMKKGEAQESEGRVQAGQFAFPPGEGEGGRKDAAQAPKAGGGEKSPPIERNIIYTADVWLAVTDFAKAEQELAQLIQSNKGYVAHSDVAGSTGGSRQSSWKVRIPVKEFGGFREAVKKLGELLFSVGFGL